MATRKWRRPNGEGPTSWRFAAHRHPTAVVVLSYALLTVAMTWPLARGMTQDLPADLGDPLLNVWILDWMLGGIVGVSTGSMALGDVWNANIFHPEPLSLGFSEHLFGQALQVLPLRALTGNLILLYNVLFLSTFFLSALGMYLLMWEMTGRRDAAFVAGLLFAFAPLRAGQLSHVQMLGTQWMPLSLYAWRRFMLESSEPIRTSPHPSRAFPELFGIEPRHAWLVASTLATLLVIWSSGYYLLYFTPFLSLFALHQLWATDRWRDLRCWRAIAGAAIVIGVGTWPFVSLYAQVRAVHGFERPADEIAQFSADLAAYLTAPESLRLWGSFLRVWPRAEGELFLGALTMALGGYGILAGWRAARSAATESDWACLETGPYIRTRLTSDGPTRPASDRGRAQSISEVRSGRSSDRPSHARHILAVAFAVLLASQVAALAALLVRGGVRTAVLGIPLRATSGSRLLFSGGVTAAGLLLLSPGTRRTFLTFARSWIGFALAAFILSVWLSLGPLPTSAGRPLEGLGLYGLLFEHVPGFGGLRVPARLALVASCFLVMLSGAGLAQLLRRSRRPRVLTAGAAALCLLEGCAVPIPVNATWGDGLTKPPPRVYAADDAPAVYRQLASLPRKTVIAEFPFGDPAWELRYVYYATVHRHRLLNGYSGGFPREYQIRVARFERLAQEPGAAWQALLEAGTTHVVLHRREMGADAEVTSAWLLEHGARLEGTFDGGDEIYRVK